VNPCGLEPQLIKLEFIIYLPKLKVVVEFRLYFRYLQKPSSFILFEVFYGRYREKDNF
jgi:hypothetical protein